MWGSCDISDRIRHDLQMQIMDLTEKDLLSPKEENEVLTKELWMLKNTCVFFKAPTESSKSG